MIPLILCTLLLFPLAVLFNTFLNLSRNVWIAHALGIPYVIVPIYAYNRIIMLLSRPILRFIDKQWPKPSLTSWRTLVKSNWPWTYRHEPFVRMGTYTFLTVAPGGIILYTADADVIAQVMARGADFQKPTFLYASVDVYGKNVLSSEGAAWRYHRKLTSPAFSEKNNRLVWKETLEQSQEMLASWVAFNGSNTKVHRDSMRLSLNVISRAGLGQKMSWPKSVEDGDFSEEIDIPSGHTMSFSYSLKYLLEHILIVMLLPKWLLKRVPFSSTKTAYKAYDEWGKYMREVVTTRKTAVQHEGSNETLTIDIVGQLVKGQSENQTKTPSPTRQLLIDSEVMGNLFVFMFAGHETSANSIHFCLLFLALHPTAQKAVQADLDAIFAQRPIAEWDYDADVSRLLGSRLGAVLSEQLRLVAPIVNVPKIVKGGSQRLRVEGKEVTLPEGMMLRLCVPSVQRNPRFWPHGKPREAGKSFFPPGNEGNDLEEFKPERWLRREDGGVEKSEGNGGMRLDSKVKGKADSDAVAGLAGQLFTPVKGSYIPFSDGQRACLGRRFAQVEIMAALAVVLREHSVELGVEKWASDEEVAKHSLGKDGLGKDENEGGGNGALEDGREWRRRIWKKAEDKANTTWQTQTSQIITLQLARKAVPLRIVRRGEERFWDI